MMTLCDRECIGENKKEEAKVKYEASILFLVFADFSHMFTQKNKNKSFILKLLPPASMTSATNPLWHIEFGSIGSYN